MAVLRALRHVPGALRRNPVLFVPILVVMAFQVPPIALQSISPILGSLVSVVLSLVFVLVLPFFQGGLIAMADESLDGRTSLRSFVTEGKAHYLSFLVAYLAVMAVNVTLGMGVFVVGLFGGVLILESGGLEGGNVVVLAIVAGVVGLILLAYLLVLFFLQFYGQAIVLDGRGVVDGFKRSGAVVRGHLVSTVGYSIVAGVAGGLAGVVFAGASLLLSPEVATEFGLPDPSLLTVGVVVVVLTAGGALFGGFFAVYSVAFYRTITDRQTTTA